MIHSSRTNGKHFIWVRRASIRYSLLMDFFCCAFLLASLQFVVSAEQNRTSIYFSYITTLTGPGFRSGGAIPVVDLALEQINNRTDILPNYTLSYTTIRDSKCDVTASLNAFNEDFVDVDTDDADPTFLTLLGCGCSTATIPVAEISHYWNVPHIAFDAAANVLTDRKRFRNFFRTLPQYEFLPRALFQTTIQFKWTQMAVITQSENLFTSITDELAVLFQQRGWSLDTTINIKSDSDPFSHEAAFHLNGDYRIIFINTYPNFAFALLCQAYHRNMLAPKYVWITPSWYQENWWKSSVNANCTPEVMKQVVNGSLAIAPSGFFPLVNDTAITTSKLSPREYEHQYDIRLNDTARYQNLTKVGLAGTAFDAIWAIGLALHNASESVRMNDSSGCEDHPGELVPLEEFDYRNKMMGCVLRRSMGNVKLAGITGKIEFNENGSRIDDNDIVLHQYRITDDSGGLIRKVVAKLAIVTNSSSFTFANGENSNTMWAGGVPYDGSAVDAVHRNHIAMEIIYSILATAGLVFTAVCFVFNLLFRNTKIVKLSSPNLNYLIIFGGSLLYASVYMHVFVADKDSAYIQTILCNIREWFASIGYDICFAVILAKTWRVYYIFTNPNPQKKILKDWILLLIVVAAVSVDFLIIAIGTAIPSSRLNATLVRDTQHPTFITAEQTNIHNFVYTCIGSSTVIWFSISYAYKGLLQLVAMFMAFHIRRVKIKALNDSKEIAVIIYINSIVLVLVAVIEFALSAYHEVYAALLGLGIMVVATLFLTLVFIPKMINLIKDPKGESVFDDSNITDKKFTTGQLKNTESSPSAIVSQNEELTKLRNRVVELEEKLAVKSV